MDGNRLSSIPPQPSSEVCSTGGTPTRNFSPQARREQNFQPLNAEIEGGSNLPLLELFTKLKEAGLPLGIDEYQLVLRSLQAGFGISDTAALKRLCETLWVKSAEERRLFDYHFEQVMSRETVLANVQILSQQRQISQITRYVALAGACFIAVGILWGITSSNQNQTPKDPTNLTNTAGLTKGQAQNQNAQTNPSPSLAPQTNQIQTLSLLIWRSLVQFINSPSLLLLVLVSGSVLTTVYSTVWWINQRLSKQTASGDNAIFQENKGLLVSDISSNLTQVIEDEVQVAKTVLQAASKNDQISYNHFAISSDYLPVTQRQMKQVWRHLRRMIREGASTELDMEATVKQIGYQGNLLEPVIVPRRVNRTELILLIDQDGSMVPFHSLSQRLAETALQGGRLGKSNIYYFHNCPVEYLYHDPNHQQAELIQDILAQQHKERTVVLIFSDAGAARGGFNSERIDLTEAFIKQLKQCIRYVAWLNPMPKKRWLGTTSEEIARLIPMFEVNRRGVQNAIDVLRGRSANVEK